TSAASVHSATAAEISGGRLRAFWYGGSREGASDVAIYPSVYSLRQKDWSPESAVVTREFAQRHLRRSVRKLGNPVAGRDSKGRLCLYFVSVSVGGWAGSAVNLMVSEDEGETWSPPRRLIASPFFNISTLVKGAPPFFRRRRRLAGVPRAARQVRRAATATQRQLLPRQASTAA